MFFFLGREKALFALFRTIFFPKQSPYPSSSFNPAIPQTLIFFFGGEKHRPLIHANEKVLEALFSKNPFKRVRLLPRSTGTKTPQQMHEAENPVDFTHFLPWSFIKFHYKGGKMSDDCSSEVVVNIISWLFKNAPQLAPDASPGRTAVTKGKHETCFRWELGWSHP